MRTNTEVFTEIGKVAGALGKGLLAGLAGTAAITTSQMIEMAIEKREQSTVPAKVASKVLGVEPVNEEKKSRLSQQVHWAYGTAWGLSAGYWVPHVLKDGPPQPFILLSGELPWWYKQNWQEPLLYKSGIQKPLSREAFIMLFMQRLPAWYMMR